VAYRQSYLATYKRYWRINVLTMLEYRANFLMWGGFTVVYHASAILALWVTLRNFPSINGWDFRQTAFTMPEEAVNYVRETLTRKCEG